jgi:hypothetical protein
LLHIDNLAVVLQRQALHAPTSCPDDGLVYKTIHNTAIQDKRRVRAVTCGPGGVIHDYVAFYFGPLSPMLLQLHTGQVPGYSERQDELVYLVSTAQRVEEAGYKVVFSDGHAIAALTQIFDSFEKLTEVCWDTVGLRYWTDTRDEPDRQRRKQAEFLIHRECRWSAIDEIVVFDDKAKKRVEGIMATFAAGLRRPVRVQRDWYIW